MSVVFKKNKMNEMGGTEF